jgi:hypothetical protein
MTLKLFVPPPSWNFAQYMPDPLVGIATGGCVGSHPWGKYWAHSHCRRKGNEPFGWICVRYPEWTTMANGAPTPLVLHELAHIITDEEHTVRWGQVLESLGGRVDPSYELLPVIDQRTKIRPSKHLGSTLNEIGKAANKLESSFRNKR